ncbi:MAG: hypothetical protein WC319_06495 [Candidatus Paceibacterota bacterium]
MGEKLLKEPFGASKYPWNNLHMGTCIVYCEVCGTLCKTDSDAESLTVDQFLGRQIVEECCGGLLDLLFEESGEEFAIRFFKEFSKDPLNPRYAVFRITMDNGFAAMNKKMAELQEQITINQDTLKRLTDT